MNPQIENRINQLKMYEDHKLLKEEELQEGVLEILRESGILLWHNNNNSLNGREGGRNKKKGVLAGVLDLTIVLPNKVMFIELKTKTGTLKPIQKEHIQRLIENNIPYKVIRGVDEFVKFYKEEIQSCQKLNLQK